MDIDKLFTADQTSLNNLSALIDANVPIVIFGSGNLGQKVATALISSKKNVVAFSDNNSAKWGSQIRGLTIISPDNIKNYLTTDGICIVAIWSPGHSYLDTRKQLQEHGVQKIFHGAAILQLFPQLLPHYHFQTPKYFQDHKKQIGEVYESLSDEESKKQYSAHLNCRINLDFAGLPNADIYNQYFPSDIVQLLDEEIFLDAGAYDGDTLRHFLKKTNNRFRKYIALEPDPKNYEKLLNTVRVLDKDQIDIFPYAVGEENCILKFNATGGEGAGVSADGAIEVDCRRIDDVFFNFSPTFLKFDIEGAELGALIGAEKTIKTYRPKIAVCLYHLPSDLWTIPLLLKSYNKEYKFFMRTHSSDGFEFVLYAM